MQIDYLQIIRITNIFIINTLIIFVDFSGERRSSQKAHLLKRAGDVSRVTRGLIALATEPQHVTAKPNHKI